LKKQNHGKTNVKSALKSILIKKGQGLMINKNEKTQKYRKYTVIGLAGLLALGLGLGGFWLHRQNDQTCFYPGLIRFHVIANSNSVVDQALKYQVRDVIIKDMSDKFTGVKDITTAKKVARVNLKRIHDLTRQQISNEGKNYPARVEMGRYFFPPRKYNYKVASMTNVSTREITLPAGRYETVRVVIGQGKGDNWWCVLFPPLCLTDPVGVVKATKSPSKAKETEPAFRLDTPQTITAWAPLPAEAKEKTPAEAKDKASLIKKTQKTQVEFRFKSLELIRQAVARWKS